MPCHHHNNVPIDDERGERWPPTIVRVWLCLTIIAAGLALRRFGFGVGLPASIAKYAGSILWATMVFFLTSILGGTLAGTSASIAGVRLPRWRIALISAVIAVSVELFRLVHAPWLDAFRLTLAGALLLGRIFSPWDMVAYGAGIILGVLLDRWVGPRFVKATP
jgi:hydrogenase/urease accessory protein HupE